LAKISPTQNSLKKIKTDGYTTVAIVEHWNPFARVRQDLFGFIDILAISDDGEVLAIQCTSKSNMSARIKKIESNPHLPACRAAGFQIEVWGWFKNKQGRWECKIEDIS
jgi:hypothetical protein